MKQVLRRSLEIVGVFLIYLFLFLPMFVLVALSFNGAVRGVEWQGFTLSWYSKLLEDQVILEALSNSLEIAFQAMILSVVLGLCVGMVMVRGSKSSRAVMGRIGPLPMMLPDILLGLSLLCFFVWLTIPLGKTSVVIAHGAFGTAYVASLVRARLASMDPLIEDAAADLGATQWEVLWKVIIPQIQPALLSGGLMVFTLSFDDFIIAFFTAGVGATTLPLKIYSMLKFGMTPEVNALSAMILCASLVLVTIAFWNQHRTTQKTQKESSI